ncbi:hypothetical protein DFJ74DRAFT_647954 [Hyaloraphidium curvatum]|nr:hypothetical protein DFJ74DRAFT_647954 [Hyaloraphidium curvatum]
MTGSSEAEMCWPTLAPGSRGSSSAGFLRGLLLAGSESSSSAASSSPASRLPSLRFSRRFRRRCSRCSSMPSSGASRRSRFLKRKCPVGKNSRSSNSRSARRMSLAWLTARCSTFALKKSMADWRRSGMERCQASPCASRTNPPLKLMVKSMLIEAPKITPWNTSLTDPPRNPDLKSASSDAPTPTLSIRIMLRSASPIIWKSLPAARTTVERPLSTDAPCSVRFKSKSANCSRAPPSAAFMAPTAISRAPCATVQAVWQAPLMILPET